MMKNQAYAKAGVNIVAADRFTSIISKIVTPTLNDHVFKSIGGYAGLYRLNSHQFLAATTDGVGTKLKLAFALNKHNSIGIDLVAMSVNDLVCVGATPLFFLDYFATGKLKIKQAQTVLRGIAKGCKQAKVALIGGETAEMPSMYRQGEYDLAGFAVGVVSSQALIDGSRIVPGDVLIGIESSGPHSNGYSLIRKLLRPRDKKWLIQCLKPTLIYVDAIQALQKHLKKNLKGLAHITGSGFLNIPRMNEKMDYEISLPSSFMIPKIFLELKKRGKLSWEELYTTFNMGIGMVMTVSSHVVPRAREILLQQGFTSHMIGRVIPQKISGKSCVKILGSTFEIDLLY